MLMSINPQDLVKGSVRLSSLPSIFFEINEVINNPSSSFEDVAQVIKNDTSLSARLLKIVNSSFYNFPSEIETINHAISIIGTQQVRDLALATTIMTAFEGIPEDLVSMDSFWRHSVAVATAAKIIAIHCRQPNSERFYLSGILHDVGRLIIFENIPGQAEEIVQRCEENKELLTEVETSVLGFDHAAVGSALLKAWKLPHSLDEEIAFHHAPTQANRFPTETAILHLADILAKAMELGSSGDPLLSPLDPKAWDLVGIPASLLPTIWGQVEEQYGELVEIFL